MYDFLQLAALLKNGVGESETGIEFCYQDTSTKKSGTDRKGNQEDTHPFEGYETRDDQNRPCEEPCPILKGET